MCRLWFEKSNYKSEKISLEFNQKNNDLIYQRKSLHLSKIFLKWLGILAYSFKAWKSLLRFDSILFLIFCCSYCIIILIVILIRLEEFTCLNYCSVYLDALTLRLFISRKIDRIYWWTLLKYFTSLGLAIVFNSSFHCKTTS